MFSCTIKKAANLMHLTCEVNGVVCKQRKISISKVPI